MPLSKTMQIRSVGQRLARIRNALELTQEEAAEAVSVSRSAWANWERGIRQPDQIAMVAFANRFNVTLDYIWAGEYAGLRYELAVKLKDLEPGAA